MIHPMDGLSARLGIPSVPACWGKSTSSCLLE